MSTTNTSDTSRLNTSEDSNTIDLHAWLTLLIEKWWVMAVCVLVFLALAAVYLYKTAPVYTAQAIVEVIEDTTSVIKAEPANQDDYKTDSAVKSVESAFNSSSLLLRVAKATNLANEEPGFKAAPGEPAFTDSDIADLMLQNVEAKLIRGTRNIQITYSGASPTRAATVAGAIVDEYIKMYYEKNAQVTTEFNNFLQKQAVELKARVAKSDQALQAYREEHGTVSLEEKQNVTADYLKQLSFRLEEARSNRVKIEGDLPILRQADSLPVDKLLSLQSISDLKDVQETQKLLTAKQGEFGQVKMRYLELHPIYIQTQSEIKRIQEVLEKAVRNGATIALNSYQAAVEAEAKLKDAMQEQQKSGVELSRLTIGYDELRRQAESDRRLYESVLDRINETKLSEHIERNNVRLVQDPLPPHEASKPKPKLILAGAFVGGAALAFFLIILNEAFNTTLRSVDQAENLLNLTSLTAVPELKDGAEGKSGLVLVDDPSSKYSEAFRCLRTSLALLPGGSPKIALFTSSIPGEGKSFCSANHAVALARQDLRTLIIDADLRKPGQGKFFATKNDAPGLSNLLSGETSFDAACHETTVPNLKIMPSGSRNTNPLELLSSGKLAEILREAGEKFDHIVLDTAPINAVSDTLLIVKHASEIVFVVRARKTPTRQLQRALQLLRSAKGIPAGFVLNRLPTSMAGYYYYDVGKYSSSGVYGT